jgi:hypothetical protein
VGSTTLERVLCETKEFARLRTVNSQHPVRKAFQPASVYERRTPVPQVNLMSASDEDVVFAASAETGGKGVGHFIGERGLRDARALRVSAVTRD